MHYSTDTKNNRTVSAKYLFLTIVFAFGCMFFGYLFLPFAAGYYALLILSESRGSRYISTLVPAITLIINFIVNGFFSLEGISYAFVGLLIAILYYKRKSKSESAFYITVLILLLMLISAIIIAFEKNASFQFSSVYDFYGELYFSTKENAINLLTRFATVNSDGVTTFLFSVSTAEYFYHQIVKMIIPFVSVIAFVMTGISFKIFSSNIEKKKYFDFKVNNWSFFPSNLVAYFYLILSFCSLFASSGFFVDVVNWLNMIFSSVFAYMGFKFFLNLNHSGNKNSKFLILLIIFLLFVSSFAFTVLAYIGVYFTVSSNNLITSE